MHYFRYAYLILIACILFVGCSSSGTGSEGGGGEEPEQYRLTASPDPSEGGSVAPGNETYEDGTQVSVEATPSEGWEFTEWSGDRSSTDNPFSFTITGDTDLRANFEEAVTSYSFTTSASPTEAGTVNPQDTTVKEGSQLSVEATAENGWQFTKWSGDTSSTENPLSLTITGDTDVTANFEEVISAYDFTAAASPSEGGTVDPEGDTFDEGSEVTVEATANEGWNFTGWSGDIESNENPLEFTIESNTDLTANFEKKSYNLSTTANPSGAGSIDPSNGTFEHGTEVTIEATPDAGWKFTSWSGDVSSADNPLIFTITESTNITGNFEQVTQQYNFSTQRTPEEAGSVNPSGGTFDEGTEVTVEASPNEGWEFTGWSGDIETDENPLTFTIEKNTNLSASFEKKSYSISTTVNPSEAGSIEPSEGSFEHGTEVELKASSNEGWVFTEWTGDIESTENPLSFTIENDTDLTANFEKKSYTLSTTVNPSGAGSIDPSNGTFEHGTEVTIEATPDAGWKFAEWTGDLNSTDNPLSFNINSHTKLTANFEQLSSEYTFSLTVKDSEDSFELTLGQTEGATNGFDSGIDTEAPPPPPEGALNAYFEGQERKLLDDFRAATANNLTWTLNYQIGSGEELTLSWSLDETMLNGSVTLTDSSGSLQVDMLNETEFSFNPSAYEQLLIEYEVRE